MLFKDGEVCFPCSSLRGELSSERGEVGRLGGSVRDEFSVYRVEATGNLADNVAIADNLVSCILESVE